MAGGIGSRFWPLSRTERPKQFVDALGLGKTFIQMTYERFARFIPQNNFLVVTGENYKELVLEQLPQLNPNQVLTEPVRRNTAPCIAYATYKLYKENPNAVVVVTPSDQYIGNESVFESVMCRNLQYALAHDALVTIGITPSFPATGYGYIQLTDKNVDITKVVAFKEKPALSVAQEFLASGNYVWNSGIFIWSLSSIRNALERYLPDIAIAFDSITKVYGTQDELRIVNAAYLNSRSISIDYGVMEKADNVFVSCADFGWSDVGTWGSLYQQLDKEENNNAISGGTILCSNTSGCLIKELDASKRVVVDGLTDYIVVDANDVLMICPRKDEEAIKHLIEKANTK
ncbi:MAG: mannose-1-phosphate guanylyltransferase [Bacteroides sp.]|uniref:mannose-1-phosphate guanylyltransferase n=1 Tax=Bacteroides sp. TaxID=29523 RepID=UPI002FCC478B